MTTRRKQPVAAKQTPPEVQAEALPIAPPIGAAVTVIDNPFDDVDLPEVPASEIPAPEAVAAPVDVVPEQPVSVPAPESIDDVGDDTPPTADVAPAPVKLELPDTVETLLQTKYKLSPDGYPPALKIVISGMETYLKVMEDGVPVTPNEGATQQRNLNNLFMEALTAPGNGINMCMDVILYQMNKHALAAFTPRLAYRFLTLARMSTTQVICFQNLIHLFTNTADPKSRRIMLRQIDLNKVLSYLPNEQSRQNLITYYTTATA